MRLKRNEAGLYVTAKKRGRPFGTGSFARRGSKPQVTPTKRSPDEPSKRGGHLGKRKVSGLFLVLYGTFCFFLAMIYVKDS